jgi:hypothetical protein
LLYRLLYGRDLDEHGLHAGSCSGSTRQDQARIARNRIRLTNPVTITTDAVWSTVAVQLLMPGAAPM